MDQLINNNLLIYSFFILATIFKFHSTSLIQAIARLKSGRFKYLDDAKFFGKEKGIADGKLSTMYEAAQRVWQNDIENIYPYLLVSLVFSFSNPETTTQIIYFTIFFLSRVMHSLFLIFPRQPFRNIFYQTGNIITVVTISHTIWNFI